MGKLTRSDGMPLVPDIIGDRNPLRKGRGHNLKNHVWGKSKTIRGRLKKTFGIEGSDLVKACYGDIESASKIGRLGEQGALAQEFAPRVKRAAKDAIAGTRVLNETLAEVIKDAGKDAIAIDKAQRSVELAANQYNIDDELSQLDFGQAKIIQKEKHKYDSKYLEAKGAIEQNMIAVDGRFKLLQQAVNLQNKNEEIRYQQQKQAAIGRLEKGDRYIEPELKQYAEYDQGIVGGLRTAFRNVSDFILGS